MRTRRSPSTVRRPYGPYRLEPDGRSVKIPARNGDEWVWFRIDAAELRRFMAYRWRLDGDGYPITTVYDTVAKKATHLAAHRMVTNAPPGVLVDHRRGNRLDARRCMLRFATHSQNSANTRLRRRGRLSKYRGVTLHKQTGKWQAQAKKADKFVHGGLHTTQEAAALAYNKMAVKLWGPFARLNRIRKAAKRARKSTDPASADSAERTASRRAAA